jgi:hypothetical protein
MCAVPLGSWGGRRLRMAGYVPGAGTHEGGERCRRGLMLPLLREKLLPAGEAMGLPPAQAKAIAGPGVSRYFLPAKNSLIFSPLNLAPSTTVWPTPVNISLNPGPT